MAMNQERWQRADGAECRRCGGLVTLTGWCPTCKDWTTEFDAEKSEEAKQGAIQQVDQAAEALWKQNARAAVEEVCRMRPGGEFTTDAVWYVLEQMWNTEGPHERRAMGPVMLRAARDGLIAQTDRFQKTTRKQAHRAPLQVWRVL